MQLLTAEMMTGQTELHLDTQNTLGCSLHKEAVSSLLELQQLAAREGFSLQVASGFRSFDRQLKIWNAKARGERPVYDSQGQPLDIDRLSPRERVFSILRWSALPGASRHHWGTDIDIFDRAAVPADYQLQLSLEESYGNGPFAPLHRWLDSVFKQGACKGFFRPYQIDRGGVAPEPWHLSFAPVAAEYQRQFELDFLRRLIDATDMCLRQAVLDNLGEIFQRFIKIPWEAYPKDYSKLD